MPKDGADPQPAEMHGFSCYGFTFSFKRNCAMNIDKDSLLIGNHRLFYLLSPCANLNDFCYNI